MPRINKNVYVNDNEIEYVYTRSSGPGGQNVNKVSTGVQLRFDILKSGSLNGEIKRRLVNLAGSRLTKSGVLIINSTGHRTQYQNKQDALNRFVELVRKSVVKPPKRAKTKPPARSKLKRLREKKKRSELKKLRKYDFS